MIAGASMGKKIKLPTKKAILFAFIYSSLFLPTLAKASTYSLAPSEISVLANISYSSFSSFTTIASNWISDLVQRLPESVGDEKTAIQKIAATRPATPAPRHPPAQREDTARAVFQSVAIPFKALPSRKSWERVYPAVAQAEFSRCGASSDCASKAKHLARVVTIAKDKTFGEKLAAINIAVNKAVAYTSDRDNYGTMDYWAKPGEILSRGRGDCEDYAILKMAALNSAGIPMASMSIVILQDQRRQLFHAVLAVSTSKGHYILDNLHDRVMVDTQLSDYLPLYSLSGERSWIHGKKVGERLVASIGTLPAGMTPGEGIH
ncbi:transglutaminase-like cysteine peptidase [Nitratireductor indicus]|nr:transglutaminase-like cysteine peptidase [Nitratireductor indicus]